MPNLREIQNFKPQNHLHQRMLNSSIANFFAILLQCNSKHRIALQCLELHCSKHCKKKKKNLSDSLSSVSHLCLSNLHRQTSSLSLQSPSPNPAPATQHHITPFATATRNPAPQSTATPSPSPEPATQHHITPSAQRNQHGDTQPTIHDP